MHNPHHLTQSRHGIFQLRFPIPLYLLPDTQRRYVKLSLETRCPQEALHQARALCYAGAVLLRHPRINFMDYQDIRAVIKEHFLEVRANVKQRLNTHGRLTNAERAVYANRRSLAASALETEDYGTIGTDKELAELIASHSLSITPDTKDFGLLRTEYLKGQRDLCASVIELDSRFEGYDLSTKPENVAIRKATQRTNQKRLKDVIEHFIQDKLRLGKWQEHSVLDYRGKFNLLLKIVGEDAPLYLSPVVAAEVKDILVRLPKHMSNKSELKDLSLVELLNLEGYEPLSAVTVNKYISTYSSLYDWAVKRRETDENNFRGMLDDVKKKKKPREEFNRDEIRVIIDAAMNQTKLAFKWGTLIAFYTGARLNEIAQLNSADIVQEDGIWCFQFTAESTDDENRKRLKNESSERTIPIHSKLIELGFLEYADEHTHRLFPALTYHAKNGYGRNLGRWFNESLLRRQLGITNPKLVFHSIRHTVAQRLKNESVPESTIMNITGHAPEGVLMKVYATGLDKRVMAEAIESLRYT